jgi:hypothetical protein
MALRFMGISVELNGAFHLRMSRAMAALIIALDGCSG